MIQRIWIVTMIIILLCLHTVNSRRISKCELPKGQIYVTTDEGIKLGFSTLDGAIRNGKPVRIIVVEEEGV